MIAVTTTSTNIALADAGNHQMVYNDGSALAFLAFGTSSVAATTSDMPIPTGAIMPILNSEHYTYAAALSTGGTANLYLTAGRGF